MLDLINHIKNGPPKRPAVARAREGKPAGTWKAWSGSDMAALKLMAGKHTPEVIAGQLGRSTGAVVHKAHAMRISLSLREFDPSIIDAARVLQEAGFTAQQIIDIFEIGKEKAKRIRRALEGRK